MNEPLFKGCECPSEEDLLRAYSLSDAIAKVDKVWDRMKKYIHDCPEIEETLS